MIKKIISGGQTGADIGAIDAALKYSFPYGGWIPKGRLTENGPLPNEYQLMEMPTKNYPARPNSITFRNTMFAGLSIAQDAR